MEKYNTQGATLVVIPAYNESATISPLLTALLPYCANIVVVDDGSSDDTVTQVQQFPVTLIQHTQNQGKGASLVDGMRYAIDHGFAQVITMDADLQHDPQDIPKLLQAHQQQPKKLIIASRLLEQDNAPKGRLFANRFANFWVSWAAGHRVIDSQSGFRLYPVELLKQVNIPYDKTRSFVFESQIVIAAAGLGYLSVAVPIKSHYPEKRRASYYRPGKDTWLITKMIAAHLLRHFLYLPGLWRSLR